MEIFLNTQFSWAQFVGLVSLVILFYIVLFFIKEFLQRLPLPSSRKDKVQGLFHNALVIYEPFAFLILMIAFVFVNPLFHGILILLVLLASFTYMKSYMSGRILLLNKHIEEGTILKIKSGEGLVTNLGRMGLDLQTNEGLHRVNYATILEDGYTLVASDDIGGFYQLRVSPKTDEKINHTQYLADLLATTPYIDWSHKPDVVHLDELNKQIEIRVLIKEENHLYDLVALIKEWGYNCQLIA